VFKLKVIGLFREIRGHSRRAGWALADQGINPLVQLFLTPYLLLRLGRQDFGIWILALTIVSMSQLVSFGSGIAATKHVSADLGAGKGPQAIETIRAALAVATVGGLAACISFWLFAGQIATTFFAKMGSADALIPVLSLCGLAAAVQEIDNVFVGVMRGAERFDLCAKAEVPVRVAMGCVLAFLAERSASVQMLLLVLIAMMLLKAILKGWQVASLFQDKSCCWPSFNLAPVRRVLRFGAWQWLQTAGTVFFSAADQLLVGGLLGGAALSRYSVCLQIGQYVHMLPSAMMQVIFPRLSALGEKIDSGRGNEILRLTTTLAVGISLALGLPIILMSRVILTLWIGADFAAANYLLLIVLVIVHITLAFNIAPYFVLLASGRPARSATLVLIAGMAQFVFAIAAAPFGILAVACNRFVYSLLTAFLYGAARYKSHE
jgi:O-antigen/teichoic acid export membrane protein